jgi:hypothetical protein
VNTYTAEMAFVINGTHNHNEGVYDYFTLVMYTPADNSDCQNNVLTPPSSGSQDTTRDIDASNPDAVTELVFDYPAVGQSVQGCSAVEYDLFVKQGTYQEYDPITFTYNTVDNWIKVSNYLNYDNVESLYSNTASGESTLNGYRVSVNITDYYNLLSNYGNSTDSSFTITFAWITTDSNTNTTITDEF